MSGEGEERESVCVSVVCGQEDAEDGGGWSGYRTKNKKPTRQCGKNQWLWSTTTFCGRLTKVCNNRSKQEFLGMLEDPGYYCTS